MQTKSKIQLLTQLAAPYAPQLLYVCVCVCKHVTYRWLVPKMRLYENTGSGLLVHSVYPTDSARCRHNAIFKAYSSRLCSLFISFFSIFTQLSVWVPFKLQTRNAANTNVASNHLGCQPNAVLALCLLCSTPHGSTIALPCRCNDI